MECKAYKFKETRIELIPIGDCHMGDKAFTEDSLSKLKGYINYIKEHVNAYCFLMGDLCNCATLDSKSSPFAQNMDVNAQIKEIVKLFAPIKKKILGAIDGNHELRLERYCGYSPTISICERLEIPYFKNSAVIIFRLCCHGKKDSSPRATFTGYFHHTTGGGSSMGSKINKPEQLRSLIGNCDFYCLTEDTIVKTEEGFFRIKDIREGDKVLTKEGDYKPVTKLYKRKTDNIKYITTQGGFQPLGITSNHPVLVADVIKKRTSKGTNFIVKREPYFKKAGEIKNGDFLVVAKDKSNNEYPIPRIMGHLVDGELAKFIGLYLAEGNTSKNGIMISLNDKEKDLIDFCKSICNRFDITFTESVVPGTHSYQMHIHSKRLMTYFLEFGKTAHSKRIPEKYYYLNDILTKQIAEGYFLGDGCKKNDRDIMNAKTVSQELAYGIGFILNRLGRRTNISYTLPRKQMILTKGHYYKSDCAACYNISYSLNDKLKRRIQLADYDLVEVIDIHSLNKNVDVYNLEVKDSHTYTANGIIVHNCGAHNHSMITGHTIIFKVNETTERIEQLRQIVLTTGGYLQFDNSYVEEKMLPPMKIGSPKISLITKQHNHNDVRKDIHVSL